MMASKLFIRRRDGRIECRLNTPARDFVDAIAEQVERSDEDPTHEWRATLSSPINPVLDHDDPLSVLKRQSGTLSNAQLCRASVRDEFINDAEAWAWMTTLQVGLRASAAAAHVVSEEDLDTMSEHTRSQIETLQLFLFALAEVL
jgi:hypothetical protein